MITLDVSLGHYRILTPEKMMTLMGMWEYRLLLPTEHNCSVNRSFSSTKSFLKDMSKVEGLRIG